MSHDFLPVHIRLRLENVLSIPVTFSIRILPVSHLITLLSRCCLLQIVTPHKLEVNYSAVVAWLHLDNHWDIIIIHLVWCIWTLTVSFHIRILVVEKQPDRKFSVKSPLPYEFDCYILAFISYK